MTAEELLIRRLIASASGVIYWIGVMIQARRVRRHIGRSPNLRPRGGKEKLLWAGWMLVVLGWVVLPFACEADGTFPGLSFFPALVHPVGSASGITLIVLGYGGTLWCYRAMGDTWRIGVNRKEKTALVTGGPYEFIRHPIYSFQLVMLGGVACLMPSPVLGIVVLFHLVCVRIKSADEESYLLGVHGASYQTYLNSTGSLFPRLSVRKTVH